MCSSELGPHRNPVTHEVGPMHSKPARLKPGNGRGTQEKSFRLSLEKQPESGALSRQQCANRKSEPAGSPVALTDLIPPPRPRLYLPVKKGVGAHLIVGEKPLRYFKVLASASKPRGSWGGAASLVTASRGTSLGRGRCFSGLVPLPASDCPVWGPGCTMRCQHGM